MCARGNDTQSSGRNEKISLISRLPVSLVDSHLEGPHPHPPSLISVRPCWEKEGKGGGVKSGIATKIAVFVNNPLPDRTDKIASRARAKCQVTKRREEIFLAVAAVP